MLGGWPKRRHFFLYLGATAAVVALTFFMLLTSESYEFAKEFVASDPRVAQVTGAQESSRIAPFKGFRSTFGDRTGEAHFTFNVAGERGRFDVRVEMEKREGRWTVVKAQATSSSGAVTDVIGSRPRELGSRELGSGLDFCGLGVRSCILPRPSLRPRPVRVSVCPRSSSSTADRRRRRR